MDFTDHKLTKQEKDDFLRLQMDKEYKKERDEYGFAPSLMNYRLKIKDIKKLNENAMSNDGIFDLYPEIFDVYYPDFFAPFYEIERIKKGEWDKTMKKYAERDLVRGMTCMCGGYYLCSREMGALWIGYDEEETQGVMDMYIGDDETNLGDKNWDDLHFQYPKTFNADKTFNLEEKGGGVLEFDPSLIDDYPLFNPEMMMNESFKKDNRIYHIVKIYDEVIDNYTKSFFDSRKRREARRSRRRRHNQKDIRANFKGFV